MLETCARTDKDKHNTQTFIQEEVQQRPGETNQYGADNHSGLNRTWGGGKRQNKKYSKSTNQTETVTENVQKTDGQHRTV